MNQLVAFLGMKQLLLLIVLTGVGSIGALHSPFWGVLLYYALAVLRPQYLWKWALPFEVRWSLLAAVATLIGVGVNFSRIALRGRTNVMTGLMLVYGALLLASLINALDPSTAQRWIVEYGKILLLAVIASFVIEHVWQLLTVAAMLLLTIGYIAYETNYLYFFDGRLDIFHYGFGGLDNNGAGLLMAMGLPFAVAFAFSSRRRWQRIACAGIGVLTLHAVLMTYSRGAMLASIFGGVWLLAHHRPRKQVMPIAIVAAVVVALLAGQEIRSRFMSTTNFEQDASVSARFESWNAAWQMAWDRPLTGQGIRNSNAYADNYGGTVEGRTIHSQYLQIAADTGIPAALVYIGMLGVALTYYSRARGECLRALERGSPRLGKHETARLRMIERMLLACQTSLLTFTFGAVFLSLEVFEVAWMLMVVGGVAPGVVRRHLGELDAGFAAVDRRAEVRRSTLKKTTKRKAPRAKSRAAARPTGPSTDNLPPARGFST